MRLWWVCVTAFSVASVVAQENRGSITGTVVDASGASIPNVTVNVIDPVRQTTSADATGKFILNLSPGVYKLRIQVAGFWIKDLSVRVSAETETSLDRVVLQVKVPPCVGNPRRPRISEAKLPIGTKPRVTGSTRGERFGALTKMTITLFVAGASRVIATTSTDSSGMFLIDDVAPGTYDLAVSFGAGTFLGEEMFAQVRNLRVREGHELELRLTWTQPPGQICL